MGNLPSGTVTFLFTDIEGSTKLAQSLGDRWETLRARHHEILKAAIESNNGYVFLIIGDAFCASFHNAGDALQASIQSQTGLHNEKWGDKPVKVRMGVHTGKAEVQENGQYYGYLALSQVQRVMSVAHGGQTLISNACAELVRNELPEGISLLDMNEHRLKGLLNPERLWQVIIPNLPREFPPLASLNDIPNNLPTQLTSFIGRGKETKEIKQELSSHRLVTLTGSGGTGKSRLSTQVAADLLDSFPDGVWFVELAPLSDPDRIPQTIQNTMGLTEQTGINILQALQEYLKEKKVLLVLDNCEHLIEACANVANELLSHSTNLKILASSREALRVQGEVSWRVPSLSLPDTIHPPESEELRGYESVQLFIERASLVNPNFEVNKTNAPAIVQVCSRLGGIPLAIELAAARIKVLSVEQVTERLDDRFRLLTGGSRTALPRQQTLRALIDWSYNLLNEKEKLLFRRLAVFVGGWGLEAAETVCSDEQIDSYDILDLMSSLVDKSLLHTEEHVGEVRYRRLETIRQYAREKFFDMDEVETLCDRHLDYYLRFAEKAEVEIVNTDQVAWLKRLHNEFDNLRAALEWSQERRVNDGLRLGSAIWRFCLRYGYTNELVEKLDQLLLRPAGIERTAIRAKTLYALSILSHWQGNSVRVHTLAEECYAIYHELGDRKGEAAGLYALGIVTKKSNQQALGFHLQSLALYRSMNDKTDICDVLIVISTVSSDATQRQAWLEEALELARERGDAITMAGALDNLGVLATDLGNFSQARSWLEESLALQRPLGASGYVTTLQYLARMATYEGNYVEARAFCNEGLALSKNAGMTGNYLWLLLDLGILATQEGKYAEAYDHFNERIELSEKMGSDRLALWARSYMAHTAVLQGNTAYAKELFGYCIMEFQKANDLYGIAFAVEGLASLHVRQERFEYATRIFAWADAIHKKIDDYLLPIEQAAVDKDLRRIHSHLDDASFEKLWGEGNKLTTKEAIDLALKELG